MWVTVHQLVKEQPSSGATHHVPNKIIVNVVNTDNVERVVDGVDGMVLCLLSGMTITVSEDQDWWTQNVVDKQNQVGA